jgi:hypothetical protein
MIGVDRAGNPRKRFLGDGQRFSGTVKKQTVLLGERW